MFFWLYLVFLQNDDLWAIKNIGVYQPIFSNTSTFQAGRGFYVLVRGDKRALIIREGSEPVNFAVGGQGPFDLANPFSIHCVDDGVAILGFTKITFFDFEGNGLKTVRIPQEYWWGQWVKVIDGWVRMDPVPESRGTMRLIWFSHDLKTTKLLKEWPFPYPPPERGVLDFRRLGLTAGPVASASGKTVYLPDLFEFRFYVFDMETKQQSRIIETELGRAPFDDDDAKKSLNYMRERGHKFDKVIYPEQHPAISWFLISPSSNLLVSYRVSLEESAPIALTLEGTPIQDPLEPSSVGRILAVTDGHYWISGFPDDEFAIARVPIHQAAQWLLDHPIYYLPPEAHSASTRSRSRRR